MRTEQESVQAWTPEQMEPGTLFLLQQGDEREGTAHPFRAVLACPSCGSLGLVTRLQYEGRAPMICATRGCSAEYTLIDDQIYFRRPQ